MRLSSGAIAASLSAGVMAAGDAAAGKAKAVTCAGCHGQNGIAMVPNYPSLAGKRCLLRGCPQSLQNTGA